jgi:hypothetical protein
MSSLRVDLILPGEQRSASPVGLKLLGRLLLIAAVAALCAFTGLSFASIATLRSELEQAEAELAKVSPQKTSAMELIAEAKENAAILQEIKSWSGTRVAWSTQTLAIARLVSPDTQLTTLSLQHDFQIVGGKVPARAYSLSLVGRCSGKGSETVVQNLKENIQRDSVTGPLMDKVDVLKFTEDAVKPEDRVFEITCKYRLRSMQ